MGDGSLPFGRADRDAPRPETGRDVTDEFVVPASRPWTVSELVSQIQEVLLDGLPPSVSVVGEISNFKRHGSGHLYFSLKDERSAIDAVMWRSDAEALRFQPEDGLEVVAEGRVDVWPKAGRLQLYVQRLTPKGTGALELAFRQLKERLQAEGLFDPDRKRPIPRFPRAIGVITSPTGAAVRDVARTLRRRWPAARVYLVGVRVQGDEAAGEIAEAIALLDASAERLGIDTIIVGRGGGSLEDLWAFNEEVVARAISAARTPIVSGVGHETDFTIADFVADLRAATPTAAAELAAPDGAELRRHCATLGGRLRRRAEEVLAAARSGLEAVQRSVVFRDPTTGVRAGRQELDELTTRLRDALGECRRSGEQRLHQAERTLAEHHPRRLLERAADRVGRLRRDLAWALGGRAKQAGDALGEWARRLAAAHPRHRLALAAQHLEDLRRHLEALSYKAPLRRGYSVTRRKGAIVRSAGEVGAGDVLETELADGRVVSQVAKPPAAKRKTRSDRSPRLFDEQDGR